MPVNEKSIRNLNPAKKGEIRNPYGKNVGIENSSKRLLRLLALTTEKKNIVTGQIENFTVAEQMDMAIIAKALKGNVIAYREIIDRLEGKAKQHTELTTANGKYLIEPEKRLTNEQFKELIRTLNEVNK